MENLEYEKMAKNEESHWWFVARREILNTLIQKFSPKKDQQILEIGCGTGGNLEMLLAHGNVTAVEPNNIARSRISQKFGNKILLVNGKLPDALNLKNKKFDLICLFDVLEHIENDRSALLEIKKFLNPGGKIILTVPAFQFLWSVHDKNLHHFRRYNCQNLQRLIKSCGLEVKEIGYFNCFLLPFALIARLFIKNSTSEKPNNFLNEVFRKVFYNEKFFIEKGIKFPFGLSCFAIIKS